MRAFVNGKVNIIGRFSLSPFRNVLIAIFFLLISSASLAAPESGADQELVRDILTSIRDDDYDSFVQLVDRGEVANIWIYKTPMADVVMRYGRIEMLRHLLVNDLKLDAADNLGYPLAFHVMTKKKDRSLELLLDYGLDPNTTWNNGDTMALMAFVQNRDHTLGLLFDRGADQNMVYFSGTLLHRAVSSNSVDMVRVLLAHNADPHIKTKYSGKTACDIASENRDLYKNIWELMESNCE